MNNDEKKDLVTVVFDNIQKVSSSKELSDFIAKNEDLLKLAPDAKKYPRIKYAITKDEINRLVDSGVITKELTIVNDMDRLETFDPFTKLLYSILWKNGDLGKEKSIISGIIEHENNEKNAQVFYYFGKYLANSSKVVPIIDQHTLRSYAFYIISNQPREMDSIISCIKRQYKKVRQNFDLEYYSKLGTSGKSVGKYEGPLIKHYNSWVENIISKFSKDEKSDFIYYLDQILFAVGKRISSTQNRDND